MANCQQRSSRIIPHWRPRAGLRCRMSLLSSTALVAMLVACSGPAAALIAINEPWVRIGGDGRTVEAFMQVTDTDGGALVAAQSPMAATVEIRARGKVAPLARLPLPAGKTLMLTPGGTRLLLRGFTGPRGPGARVPLALRFENGDGVVQAIAIDAEVRRRSPSDDERRAHAHH